MHCAFPSSIIFQELVVIWVSTCTSKQRCRFSLTNNCFSYSKILSSHFAKGCKRKKREISSASSTPTSYALFLSSARLLSGPVFFPVLTSFLPSSIPHPLFQFDSRSISLFLCLCNLFSFPFSLLRLFLCVLKCCIEQQLLGWVLNEAVSPLKLSVNEVRSSIPPHADTSSFERINLFLQNMTKQFLLWLYTSCFQFPLPWKFIRLALCSTNHKESSSFFLFCWACSPSHPTTRAAWQTCTASSLDCLIFDLILFLLFLP